MEILNPSILDNQDLTITDINKSIYGEVFTPYELINDMLDMIDEDKYKNKNLKWLDTGAGTGYFSIVLYNRLFISLEEEIKNDKERHNHIIENMIYMIEINSNNYIKLRDIFGEKANIYNKDFLEIIDGEYDIIIGNPPYNINGIVKVPTNNSIDKREDGKMAWAYFVRNSIELLKEGGYLCYIIPSIWMKPDKNKMYEYMLNYKIDKLKCLTNTETNKYFKGNAQTPTCYFLLKKDKTDNKISLYDKTVGNYVLFSLYDSIPIPVFGASIILKLLEYTRKYGNIKVIKTNMPKKGVILSPMHSSDYPYQNIRTCVLNKTTPTLIKDYSNIECAYSGHRKIILAHKMYGFPYIDIGGVYGISNRDNYVIIDRTLSDMIKIKDFLSTKLALYLFEGTRYRMKYLERYIFDLIPDITKIPNFPEEITDDSLSIFFNFSLEEREGIKNLHNKEYNKIII